MEKTPIRKYRVVFDCYVREDDEAIDILTESIYNNLPYISPEHIPFEPWEIKQLEVLEEGEIYECIQPNS